MTRKPGAASGQVNEFRTQTIQLNELLAVVMFENLVLKKAVRAMGRPVDEVYGFGEARDHRTGGTLELIGLSNACAVGDSRLTFFVWNGRYAEGEVEALAYLPPRQKGTVGCGYRPRLAESHRSERHRFTIYNVLTTSTTPSAGRMRTVSPVRMVASGSGSSSCINATFASTAP